MKQFTIKETHWVIQCESRMNERVLTLVIFVLIIIIFCFVLQIMVGNKLISYASSFPFFIKKCRSTWKISQKATNTNATEYDTFSNLKYVL